MMREAERKRLIKQELDKQLQEKRKKVGCDKEEDKMYEELQV
jgi:hypothetical protein